MKNTTTVREAIEEGGDQVTNLDLKQMDPEEVEEVDVEGPEVTEEAEKHTVGARYSIRDLRRVRPNHRLQA